VSGRVEKKQELQCNMGEYGRVENMPIKDESAKKM
jgi:hypothetical protein